MEQNLWSFKIWHDFDGNNHIQRIYFCDSRKEITGMVEFKDDQILHLRRLKDRIIKLAKEKQYREKFLCELRFPIEKYY